MRKKLILGGVAVGAFVLGSFASGSSGPATQALACPSALGPACGPVDLVIATACYTDVPDIPTVAFVTVDLEGRPVACPEL